jgi:hypothetical protein
MVVAYNQTITQLIKIAHLLLTPTWALHSQQHRFVFSQLLNNPASIFLFLMRQLPGSINILAVLPR